MAKRIKRSHNCIEAMEPRVLFSGTVATPNIWASAITPSDTPAVAPFTPAQLRHFYGVDNISFNGVTGDGSGETIAIIDAFDQPDLLNSTDPNFNSSDLHLFDVMFGLPDPPSFVKINQNGGSTLPTGQDSSWSLEESLDVEWIHAMAPAAKIVLVEADSADDSDLIGAAVTAAENYPGVVAVSMSFDEPESSDQTGFDGEFVSTTANPGITYFGSTGDNGSANTGYPSFSPRVVAVGGTAITTSDSSADYGSETVWNDAGGSTGGAASTVESKPGYQSLLTPADGARDTPDVSFEASQLTGVYLYDSASDPEYHLYKAGGTSLSAPCWAGLVAIADQGRSIAGLGPMDGFNQTLPRLYALSPNDFHDITSGNNNGETAGVGYDLATGRGTPIARLLVPDLAGGDTVNGRVFQDNNGNNVYDGSDTPLSGLTVYLDLNNNGVQDAGEPTAVTNAAGIYSFTDQIGGLVGKVQLASPPAGYALEANTSFATSYAATQTVNLGYFPLNYSTTAAAANYVVRLDSTGLTEQIWVNGSVIYAAPASIITTLSFSLTGAGDSLTIDGTNGNPVPAGGITFTGAATGDLLAVIGTASGNDAFNVSSSAISFGANPINFSNVSTLTLNPGTGTDSLIATSGSVTITPQSPGQGILTRAFSKLSVVSGASVAFATAPAHSDRMLITATTLSVQGRLDLGGNDMIVHNGNLSTIMSKISNGFAGGNWNGNGISSSAAAGDTNHLTAIGAISNANGRAPFDTTFDGQTAVNTDVLIKYTYYGDATLDGKVDGSDYSRIDNASLLGGTTWFNGDFNFDGKVDGSDYTLIDNAFNQQGPQL